MVTKGKYQTVKNKSMVPYAKFTVVNTKGSTLGERFVCCTDTEAKADKVAKALNLRKSNDVF